MEYVNSNEPDTCIVTWQFTSMCNFACSYCPEQYHDGKVKFPEYEDALYFIKEIARKNKKVYLELLGGETTLWPKLISFLLEIKKITNIIVEINTNGSRSTRWWEELADEELDMNTFLIFSYHAAFCDPDLYYNNLEVISKKYQVVSNFMLDPEHFEKTNKLYERVKNNLPVDCLYKVLRKDFHPVDLVDGYTSEMIEKINNTPARMLFDRKKFDHKNSNSLKIPTNMYVDGTLVNWQTILINRDNKFLNWKCSAGSKRIFVGLNGDVWPCSQLRQWDRNITHPDYMGNIKDRDVRILDEYMTCPLEYCGCKFDALAHKHKQ